ncbi:hypothetical protein [Actinomadura fibrosa]|uniref:Uncharacterized protein n=1 Tax=Actinomadura fibrosa TaxID=111802 RepID=A0ABW2XRQ4_9ACTN|nr:hypothetical protein [Actinomadura fibrosa]
MRRRPEKSTGEVRAFLQVIHPDGTAEKWLHAVLVWVLHDSLAGHGDEIVVRRAGERGVPFAKYRQIIAGNFAGINWYALEAVLEACGAVRAEVQVAQELFDRFQPAAPRRDPDPSAGSDFWTDTVQEWPPTRHVPPARHEPSAHPVPPARHVPPAYPVPPAHSVPPARHEPPAHPVPPARHEPPGRRDVPVTVAPPDPSSAQDSAQYVEMMKKFRRYKGDPPFRAMEDACRRHPRIERCYSYGSFSTIGKNGKLPKRDLVRAYIAGAGGSDAEIDQWLEAHIRLSVDQADDLPAAP